MLVGGVLVLVQRHAASAAGAVMCPIGMRAVTARATASICGVIRRMESGNLWSSERRPRNTTGRLAHRTADVSRGAGARYRPELIGYREPALGRRGQCCTRPAPRRYAAVEIALADIADSLQRGTDYA